MPFPTAERQRRKKWRSDGVSRLLQSSADKRAKLERLRSPVEPAVPWYSNLRDVPIYPADAAWLYNYTGNYDYSTTASAVVNQIIYSSASTAAPYSYGANYETATWQPAGIRYFQRAWQEQTYTQTAWPAWSFEAPAPISQEEADRRLAATREAAHKSAVRRKKAIKKGRKLLMEVLTETQKMEYARTKSFTVFGSDGKVYKLRKGGTTHQVDESGLAILSHCIHLPYSYIDEDTLVAVKLLLETDPATFLKIANTTKLMGISVPSLPQEMVDRAEALAGGLDTINERFAQLSVAAARARDAAARLGRAFDEANEAIRSTVDVAQAQIQNAADYGAYAAQVEETLVIETVGPIELPPAARQEHAERVLGLAA